MLDSIYAAGSGEMSWPDALTKIRIHLNCEHTCLTMTNCLHCPYNSGQWKVGSAVQSDDKEAVSSCLVDLPDIVACPSDMSSAAPRNSVKPNDIVVPFTRRVGATMINGLAIPLAVGEQNYSVFTACWISSRVNPDCLAEDLRALAPHIERALRTAHCLDTSPGYARILEHLHWGVVILDSAGSIVRMNAAAAAMLRAGDGMFVTDGRLKAARASDDRRLRAMCKRFSVPGPADSQSMRIPRRSGAPAYGLTFQRFPCPQGPALQTCAVAVFVNDTARALSVAYVGLMQLHGLTRMQARLAARLLDNDSLEAGAVALGITVGTARRHLEGAYKRMGVHSRGEFVARLLGSPAAFLGNYLRNRTQSNAARDKFCLGLCNAQ